MADRKKCIFCKIADGLENNEVLYDDGTFIVFRDIRPAAKHHFLIVPKEHIRDAKHLSTDKKELVEKLVKIGNDLLTQHGANMTDTLLGFHWPPFHSVSHLHMHAISPLSEMSFVSRMMFKPNSFWFVSPEYVMSRL